MSAPAPGTQPPPAADTADEPARASLHRSLTFSDLVVYGMLFIAPMAPVGVFGALYAASHGSVALVYAVATVAMGLTAYSYAQMVRVIPRAGSVFAYARAALGEGAGFVAGWMVLLDYMLIPAVAYLFSGIALHALVPALPSWLWTVLAMAVTTALNLTGVRAAARAGFAVLALELVALVAFVVAACAVLARDGAQRGLGTPFTGEGGFDAGAVLTGVSIAVLSYLGFDAIAGFAEEARGGSRRVARALLVCLGVTGVLFVVQTYLASLLIPESAADLAARPSKEGTAFYDAADAGVGGWLHDLVAVSKAVGAAFAALAGQAAAGRLLFAMARERRLPAPLARVHPGSGVPRRALLVAALVAGAAALWAAWYPWGLDRLVTMVDIGALTGFVLLHASVVAYFLMRRPGTRSSGQTRPGQTRPGQTRPGDRPHLVKHLVVPVLGIAVSIAVITQAAHEAQVVGAIWLAVGLVVLVVQYRRGAFRKSAAG